MWSENGDHAEVELVLRSDVELELHLAYLLEDSSQIGRVVCTSSGFFSFFLGHESFEFFTCVFYRKIAVSISNKIFEMALKSCMLVRIAKPSYLVSSQRFSGSDKIVYHQKKHALCNFKCLLTDTFVCQCHIDRV